MPENSQPPPPAEPSSDVLFKRTVVASTAFALAVAYGWLAGFVRQPNNDLSFQWRWLILLWAFVGLASTIYFWRQVWPAENRPQASRADIVKGSLALLLPGLWWLLFPLRSQSGGHLWDVIKGLIAATLVLTFGAWMVFHLGKAFEKDSDNPNDQPPTK